jgi:EAL domain-containing protein (putative c-di-GMP-specific phosphodiesterase class I)
MKFDADEIGLLKKIQNNIEQHLIKNEDGEHVARFSGHTFLSVFQQIHTYNKGNCENFGCEALFRIDDGEQNNSLSPLDFLLSLPLKERYAFDRILRAIHIRNFVLSDLSHLKIFVNIDAASYSDSENIIEGLNLLILRLDELGVEPNQVVFEITETPSLNVAQLREGASRLRASGIGVAIDDYGVKYSSFARVKAIQPDIVKFDRSWLVEARVSSEKKEDYLRNVELIKNLGIKVLLEGVELEQDLEMVDRINPDFVQGFWYDRPKKR